MRLLFILLALMLSVDVGSGVSSPNVMLPVKKEIIIEELPLTIENLQYVVEYYKIDSSMIVVAQALHETGNFKSVVCDSLNNLFGMKHPRVRTTVSKGRSKYGYAMYDHWTESVYDYKLWQLMHEVNTDYYSYLTRRGYAEDKLYIKKLRWTLYKLRENSNTKI